MATVKPSDVKKWKSYSVGARTVYAIGDNSILYAWGYGGTGLMANGSITGNNTSAVRINLPAGITVFEVVAGREHALALGSDAHMYAWGGNSLGQAGINSTSSAVPISETLNVGRTGYLSLGTIPNSPSLVSPVNHATNQPLSVTLEWSKVQGVVGYQCQVSSNSTFTKSIIVNDSSITDTTKEVILGGSTTYYWRVRSFSNVLASKFSNINSFSTIIQVPAKPALILPINNSVDKSAFDTLVCSKVTSATHYHWQLATDPTFSGSLAVNDSTIDTVKIVGQLISGTKYFWRVCAINSQEGSEFAGPDSFTVKFSPSETPTLLIPADNAKNQRIDTLVLKWRSVSGASGYEFQLSSNVSFSQLIFNKDSTSDSSFTVIRLQPNQSYYWRVRAYNDGGLGTFSSVNSFTTVTLASDTSFNVLLYTYSTDADWAILTTYIPYLRYVDIITLVTGNSDQQLNSTTDMTALN